MGRIRNSTVALAALLGVFVLSLYLLTGSSDLQHNGDTDLRYQTAQAMVDHHRLWIAHPMWVDTRVARGIGGHLYAFYAPGQAVFMAPLYLIGKALAHHLALPYDTTTLYATRSIDLWLGAALVVLFFLLAISIGYSRRVALLLSLIFALATTAWPDAQSALEQTQVNLFLLLAVFAVGSFARRGLADRRWMVLAGTGIGLCIFTRYDGALFLPVIALYPAVLRLREHRPAAIAGDWLAYGLAILPWGLLVLGWDTLRFSKPWLTGLHEKTAGEPFWSGFLGLTVSPGKGLVWYLPLVFLLPWAFPRFAHWRPGLAWLFSALIVVPLLFYSNVLYWHGDPAWGPRYLYTAVPYLILPLGTLLASWRTNALPLRLAMVGLVAAGLALSVAAVSVTQWRFWYRIEAVEARTSHPFHWGAQYYHYYWDVRQSPIPLQVDNLYQVIRLDLGAGRYNDLAKPSTCCSNPADNYPINSLAFWWADTRHPLLGSHTRDAIALLLALMVAGSGSLLLGASLRPRPDSAIRRQPPSAVPLPASSPPGHRR
ncbi:MAG: phospholipid carrier-dependent glycosyltransferase [Chloroflexota bacterium]|nr:phospholipid carrier-dependent glycosyltransferase [Chloroflexota bacterium]